MKSDQCPSISVSVQLLRQCHLQCQTSHTITQLYQTWSQGHNIQGQGLDVQRQGFDFQGQGQGPGLGFQGQEHDFQGQGQRLDLQDQGWGSTKALSWVFIFNWNDKTYRLSLYILTSKAKAKNTTFEAKANAKDKTSCPQGDSSPRPWPRGLHLWSLRSSYRLSSCT